jgi:hypothetical protein
VQEEDSAITVNLVLEPGASRQQAQPHLDAMRDAISFVMGADCPIRFVFVPDIPLSPSGKFPYIVQRKTLNDGIMAGSSPATVVVGNER